jgi:hypothetical protein
MSVMPVEPVKSVMPVTPVKSVKLAELA